MRGSSPFIPLLLFLLITNFTILISEKTDNYLIDNGSTERTQLQDGRTFLSDRESALYLSTNIDIQVSVRSTPKNFPSDLSSSLPLFLTARIFRDNSSYDFIISQPGPHWVRLYFFPLHHQSYNLKDANFSVTGGCLNLLQNFSVGKNSSAVIKEYLIHITSTPFSLKFIPGENSLAFINAIELVSGPDSTSQDRLLDASCDPVGSAIHMKILVGLILVVGIAGNLWMVSVLFSWQKKAETWPWIFRHYNPFCLFSKNNTRGEPAVRTFTFRGLQQMTNNFDEGAVIGAGGYGKVYRGQMQDGTRLAIKKLKPQSTQGENQFQTEVLVLSKVRHPNILRLIGYCNESPELILVYEYVSNGDLEKHLKGTGGLPALSWTRRLEVCVGVARGLVHLHENGKFIHRDVKASNIVLEEDFTPKVADFGTCKEIPLEYTHVSTQIISGTRGYLDPEYEESGQVSEKSDVHSFGALMLHILTGEHPTPSRVAILAEAALNVGSLEESTDPRMVGQICPKSFHTFVTVAKGCVAKKRSEKPFMREVLHELESCLKFQEEYLSQM